MPAIINSDDGVVSGSSGLKTSGANDGILALQNNGTTNATVTAAGNVGIGTSSPGYKFDVNGQARLGGSTGTVFGVGTAFAASQAEMYTTSTTPLGLGTTGSASFQFYTSSAERARITNDGNFCFGTTSTTVNPGVSVLPTGRINIGRSNDDAVAEFYRSGTRVGQINVTTTATSYITSSDYRLKENIAPMTGALATVAALNPCTYTWKADGSAGQGFIAHELAEVAPQCVTGEKDAVETYTDEEGNEQTRPVYQGIDTSFLVATLTAAIQELKAELDATKAEVAALKSAAVNGQPASP